MDEPSDDAKYLSSARNVRLQKDEKTRCSFLISAAAERISSIFSSSETLNGSRSCGVCQRSRYALTGASSTGLDLSAALARATPTASRVTLAISTLLTNGEAAKPQAPSAITRTPKPNEPPSVTFGAS